MIVIGFAGYATSGKDTAGQILGERGWAHYAFADKLRDCALALDPIVDCSTAAPMRLSQAVQRWGWDNAKLNPEVRRTLQRIGTEVGRNLISSDLWVNMLHTQMKVDNVEHATITDVRFRNELSFVRRYGVVVWISRPGVIAINSHSSEHSIGPDDCDLTINNDGTIMALRETLKSVESTLLSES